MHRRAATLSILFQVAVLLTIKRFGINIQIHTIRFGDEVHR